MALGEAVGLLKVEVGEWPGCVGAMLITSKTSGLVAKYDNATDTLRWSSTPRASVQESFRSTGRL